jgi:hypothetical protein
MAWRFWQVLRRPLLPRLSALFPPMQSSCRLARGVAVVLLVLWALVLVLVEVQVQLALVGLRPTEQEEEEEAVWETPGLLVAAA